MEQTKGRQAIVRIKYLAAIVLAVCFFLPISRCASMKRVYSEPQTGVVYQTGEEESTKVANPPSLNNRDIPSGINEKKSAVPPSGWEIRHIIPFKIVRSHFSDDWYLIIVFFWPLPFFWFQNKFSSRNRSLIVLCIIELALSLLTGRTLFKMVLFFVEPLPAGYAALLAGIILIAFPLLSILSSTWSWTARRFSRGRATA